MGKKWESMKPEEQRERKERAVIRNRIIWKARFDEEGEDISSSVFGTVMGRLKRRL